MRHEKTKKSSKNAVLRLGATALMAAADLTTAHAGTPAHDPADDSFSTTVRCHDANGELYNVTFSRDRVTVQSYSELEA